MLAPAAAQSPRSKVDEVLARGKLIVGVTSEAPPFGFIDDKGELTGFEIDIAKLIAKALLKDETKIEFVKQSSSARFPNVQSGKVDFGIQATTVYPERTLAVAFTRPYQDAGVAILVRKDLNIKKVEELNSEKFTAAFSTNPQSKERHERYTPKAKASVYDTYGGMYAAVKSKRADFLQVDLPAAQHYAKIDPDVTVLPELITDRSFNAIFLKNDDFRWWLVLDTTVATLTGGSMFGEYAAAYEKWFGVRPVQKQF
jgi:polar amino acid transport system substrate-binding protein